jgi:hypothetical protein
MDGAAGPDLSRDPAEWWRLWRAQNPDFRCRCCGANDWQFGGFVRMDGDPPNESIAGVLHYAELDTGRLLESVPTFPVVCRNCGLTELFAVAAIIARSERERLSGDDADR